jgi:hypothetical protein
MNKSTSYSIDIISVTHCSIRSRACLSIVSCLSTSSDGSPLALDGDDNVLTSVESAGKVCWCIWSNATKSISDHPPTPSNGSSLTLRQTIGLCHDSNYWVALRRHDGGRRTSSKGEQPLHDKP